MDAVGSVQIVLLETTSFSVEILEKFYEDIFRKLGLSTNIRTISFHPSQFDRTSKNNIFKTQIVDVFITDLSLGRTDTDNYDGLDIIQSVKINYPDLLVIGHTSTNVMHLDTESKIPSFDLFVHKRNINDDRYKEYIYFKIKDLFKKNVNVNIDYENSKIHAVYQQADHKIVLENIVRSLTFTTHDTSPTTLVSRVVLKQVEGGMSKSQVYRIYGFTQNNISCINALVKVSLRSEAVREYNNYLQFVKWYLPYTWRPEIISFSCWNHQGAICYSFAFNDEIEYNSLTFEIKRKNFMSIEKVISDIFNPKYRTWYHPTNLKEENSITQYYFKKWIQDRRGHDQQISKLILDLKDSNIFEQANTISIYDFKIKTPGSFLIGVPRGKYLTCICHGDLNSNNILISTSNQIIFIDFQETGVGHIFDDFVALEISLRLYYNTELPFIENLKKEREMIEMDFLRNNRNESEHTLAPAISRIRKLAFENFFPKMEYSSQQIQNYLFTLAIYAYGMIRKKELYEYQKYQLLALIFAAIKELSEIENTK